MIRAIDGFASDDAGEWVAELDCLHRQHVRHRPPFRDRAWVLSEAGRRARVGTDLDCPLCDRAELPDGLVIARTAGPFDEATVPAGLRRDHRVAERSWAVVRVLDGAVRIRIDTDPPIDAVLRAGDGQPVPPGAPHALSVDGPVVVEVDVLVRPSASTVVQPNG